MMKRPFSGRSWLSIKTLSACKLLRMMAGVSMIVLAAARQPVWAQLASGGIPASTARAITPSLGTPVLVEQPNLSAAAEWDAQNPVPYRFAIDMPVNRGIADAGTWTSLSDGSSIWTLLLKAPGALAMSVYFSSFNLPEGGRLFVYTPDKGIVLGAFTSQNNHPSGEFATALLPGDAVILEYDRPAGTELPMLTVSEVAWAYRGVSEITGALGFGQAGACEVNINCPEGAEWQKEKKGVVRIETKKYGANFWCSGTVINNARSDQTPYVLSADHCGRGATPADFNQWIFYFNFEGPACSNPTTPPPYRSLTGASMKATAGDVSVAGSDFLLVLLNNTIPDTFSVTYNGWTRLDSASYSGVCIHHPQGDIRKVSTYDTKTYSTSWLGGSPYTHWLVRWAGTQDGHGVTEGGSSGCPLFNSNGSIIGTLTGGESSCDSLNLAKPDYFGKFSYSWASNGTDSTQRLDVWLDPDNTGLKTLGGISVGISTPSPDLQQISVYPNPFQSVIRIGPAPWAKGKNVTADVLDLNGRLIRRCSFTGSDAPLEIDLGILSRGLYILRVMDDTRTAYARIIKL